MLGRRLALAILAVTACGGHRYVLRDFGEPGVANPRGAPHTGVDFRGALGDAVIAAAPGTVVAVIEHPLVGKSVLIGHASSPTESYEMYTAYLHLSAVHVVPGMPVRRGQRIGSVGATGVNAGRVPHVHLHVCKFPCAYGTADGEFDGVVNPMSRMLGCYDQDTVYDDSELTYPVVCRP